MTSELLRNLISKFQYAHCEQFVGRNLIVTGNDAIAADLANFADALAPDDEIELATDDYELMLGTIAKFGVLELYTSRRRRTVRIPVPVEVVRRRASLP